MGCICPFQPSFLSSLGKYPEVVQYFLFIYCFGGQENSASLSKHLPEHYILASTFCVSSMAVHKGFEGLWSRYIEFISVGKNTISLP